MIITNLLGGLGNQLFQYAIGRALAYKKCATFKIRKSDFDIYSLRPFALDAFNISAQEATDEDALLVLQKHLKYGVETERKFMPEIFNLPDDVYLRGDWQCEDYFKDIEDVLRKEFSLKKPLSREAKRWAKKISGAKDSVSVHIRRGDYAKNPSVRKNFGTLPAAYYQNAIDELKKHGDKFRVFVFSDDIEWVKQNLHWDFSTEYVKGVKFDYEELALMSLCKNHIIANSSFGWWGAWLDPNPDKIVIAPDPWFRLPVGNSDIIPKSWTKVPSCLDVTEPEKAPAPVVTAVLNITKDSPYAKIAVLTLLNQESYDGNDLEIIVIANDTAKDKLQAVKPLLESRENVRIIETESATPGAAYNMGLKEAKGEYVTFIGEGDCVSPAAISNIFSTAENCKADALHPSKWYVLNEAGDLEIYGHRVQTATEDEVAETMLLDFGMEKRAEFLGTGRINPAITGKLFRKSFLTEKDIAFNETLTHGEGIEFLFNVLSLGARYVKAPIPARIALGHAPHDKNIFEKDFSNFLTAIGSRLTSNNDKAVCNRITRQMAVLYLNEHLQFFFKGADFENARETAIGIAKDFGVELNVNPPKEDIPETVDLEGWKKITELRDGADFDKADDNVNYYCTLFDSNYLTRGLSMYRSLFESGENFRLYVFAFDNLARDMLRELNLPYMKVISLKEFETEELLSIKKTRTRQEYCWTCTSFSIWHCLEHFNIKEITYLDSDLYFFNSPSVILDEFHTSNSDVLITRHNYTPKYDQTETAGIYCVQFMTFKNNANGRKILKWWKDACAEWCYAHVEPGRFGDQKYLDDWTERFEGVHVMQNKAAGLAPWNIQQYDCQPNFTVNGEKAIFFHFHGLKWNRGRDKEDFISGPYDISQGAWDNIYKPYIASLKESLEFAREGYDSNFIKGILWPEYNIW